jgi:two-component sensor histidine kinase
VLFHDVRDRVRSMALVHEKLYQSESLARVEFADYARSLLSYLSRSHAPSGTEVNLKLDLQPVSLPVETAVPCGLILNELVTNAFKHAFRDRARGEITAALGAAPDGRVFLRVSDNGAGLPEGLNWRQSASLGLRLIDLLAGQLQATVDVGSEGGTRFQITFRPGISAEKP